MPATTALKNIEAGKNSNGTSVNPEFGADIAKHNIATKGIQGAVADYYQRREDYKPNIEKPTWQQKLDKAAGSFDGFKEAFAPKTGGLESTLATIDKSRAETQDLISRRK
jgi:hypothetical protein